MKKSLKTKTKWVVLMQVGLVTACSVTATTALWQSQAGNDPATGRLVSSAFDSTGNLYQLYQEGEYNSPQLQLRLVSSSGTEMWKQEIPAEFDSLSNSYEYDKVTACDSGVVLSGTFRDKIEKHDNSGNTEWEYDYSAEGNGHDTQVVAANDCDLVVTRTLYQTGDTNISIQVDQFSPQGFRVWTQTVNFQDSAALVKKITAYQLANKAVMLLMSGWPAPLMQVVLDNTGTVVREGPLGGASRALIAADENRILLGADDGTVESWNIDGSLAWSQTVPATLGQCANSSATALLCVATLFSDYSDELIRFDLADGTATRYPLNYTGTIKSVTYLGGEKWLLQENILVDNKLGRFIASPYYARLHILDDITARETSTITLQPGKVRQFYIEEFDGYIWGETSPRDNVQAVHRQGQQLLTSGWYGYDFQGNGIIQAKAYAIK